MAEKILLFYLTSNDRYFMFPRFIEEIKKVKSIKDIKILIVNSNSDLLFYEDILKNSGISYDLAGVECPQSNYLPKVRYAIEYAKNNGHHYIMKFDNDVLVPSYTFDYIIENLHLLDGPNLTISPTISTGIPSVEYFLDDFFTEEESLNIRNEFKKCLFHIQEGVMDYTPLNEFSVNNQNRWNYTEYLSGMNLYMDNLSDIGNGRTPNNYCKFYKGIHPIRHGFGNSLINDGIIKNKVKFFKEKECSVIKTPDSTYLCDMCFFIKTDTYDRIINEENLIIDGCDEVPINRFSWDKKLSHLVVKGGYAIHITYNWRWNLNSLNGGSNIEKPDITLDQYERNFIDLLYYGE